MERATQKDERGYYLVGDGIYSDEGTPEKFRGAVPRHPGRQPHPPVLQRRPGDSGGLPSFLCPLPRGSAVWSKTPNRGGRYSNALV